MDERILEELTLYLDGEHPQPAAFEAEMAAVPELAERYRKYQALSLGLRSLQHPEVHPAFATRVLANIAGQPQPSWADVMLAWRRAMLAPALVILLGLGLWWIQPVQQAELPATLPPAAGAHEVVASAAKWQDDEAVIAELVTLMAQGLDAGALVPYDGSDWSHPSEEDLAILFAGGVANWDMNGAVYDDGGLYRVMLEVQDVNFDEMEQFLTENEYQ